MVNKVILVGRLGRDPELRYTQSGQAVANFTVATDSFGGGRDGAERQKITEWHRVVAWGKQAEFCGNYLGKGRQVYIEGRLQTREWEDREGDKRRTTEVVAQTVQALGPRPGGSDGGPSDGPGPDEPSSSGGGGAGPADDDIPF